MSQEITSRLADLPFTDIYLPVSLVSDQWSQDQLPWFRPHASTGTRAIENLSNEFMPDAIRLVTNIAGYEKPEFTTYYDGVRYRAAYIPDVHGAWYVLRKGVSEIFTLDELRMPGHLLKPLKDLGRGYGLVLIAGSPGSGKTTMATSLLREYLDVYGNVAVTIEDPPELPLAGSYDKGVCYQMELNNGDWETPIKMAFRYAARYILIGEIRESGAAMEALRAAISGHLVIATIHASRIEEALQVMASLASRKGGINGDTMLADGLAAVMHLRLDKSLQVKSLFTSNSLGDPVRSIIREGRYGQLTTLIDQQNVQGLRGQGGLFGKIETATNPLLDGTSSSTAAAPTRRSRNSEAA